MHLLIVEDDPNLGIILKEYLEMKGYNSHLCRNGNEGLDAFKQNEYDLCIFDVMMPQKDGFTLAKEIRAFNKNTPFIFLTAKSLKEDTIEGLKIGADDYMTKPFSMEELLLRINAILRRTKSGNDSEGAGSIFNIGNFKFNYNTFSLEKGDFKIKLTSKEAELLRLLCLSENSILDRSVALKSIWKDDSYFNARSMDVYITKLRKHLKEDPSIQIITSHGQGFKLTVVK
jgi:two-component system, OmpR family, response regulator VicR